VSIFWTRIGTELPADFPRTANGKSYPSGTAYELLTALEALKAKGVPNVYIFRCSGRLRRRIGPVLSTLLAPCTAFANGSCIFALPGERNTGRGYSGAV